ncbi:ATP-binding cassette domain-containing protein [Paenarthrobacter sp. DKR-5]|uniref:sulfate/molybdate ABC transporter ATP-binding protein n=1 Tax=Paenarthrobacter sp. DKR-5 TaxID=2835535 RepID=UPI001BDD35B3|nr:ATP-binding cassette domain-containing protein [Paenarthrobacter sp. DKR-5]MBT1001810.1 ATP-binding cassette domain-containing protein [Paenarthrobacter sp. DKR-5]
MSLQVSFVDDARGTDLQLDVADSETVAVLGPNGAGKSTLLNVIAGLHRPASGSGRLDGETLFDLGDRARTWVPAQDRRVGLLSQDALLFPHLSVLENVAFGPRSAGAGRSEARRRASHWLEQVEALDLAGRRPGQLSGGQAQRIAVARALAAEPRLLLLDEPLAALDQSAAPLVRRLLKRVLEGRPSVIVTHDVMDALVLADRIVVVEGGRVVEQGTTDAVLERPRSRFAAGMAGLNLLHGRITDVGLAAGSGTVSGSIDATAAAGDDGVAVFRPADVAVYTQAPAGSPRNTFHVTVTDVEPHGDQLRVRAGDLAADVTPAAAAELELAPGTPAVFVVKAAAVTIYPGKPAH